MFDENETKGRSNHSEDSMIVLLFTKQLKMLVWSSASIQLNLPAS